MSEEFKGKIPPIAEKEKRGKRVKIPRSEIYVQEIQSGNIANNTGGNHPSGRCGSGNYYQREVEEVQPAANSTTSEPISDRLHK